MQEEFCITDLWAAEAYLTALDAGEPELLKMLDQGTKVHKWLQDQVLKIFPLEAATYDYDDAKQSVHSMNYGVEPRKMSLENKLPLHINEYIYNFYHNKFPRIKFRQQRIKQELLETSSITSLLGRKKTFFAPMSQELLNQAYAWPSQSAIGELTLIALTKLYYLGNLAKRISSFLPLPVPLSSLQSLPWVFPSLNTHDGLAIRCYKSNRESIKKVVKDAFNVPITKGNLTITIPVEVGWGDNFNDVTNKEIMRYE